MSIKFTKLTKVLVVATIASLFAVEVKAETKPLDDAFKDAYHTRGKDAFKQSTIMGQLNAIVGFTGFADQHIVADGKAVDRLYQESLAQQSSSGTRIMTKDLENPYDTSVMESP